MSASQNYGSTSSSRSSTRLSMNGGSSQKKRVAREVRFGAYVLGSTLGEGEFGKVKLGWRKDGKQPSQAAIKLIRRDSIPKGSEKENKIHREINALKKLAHPNIVRLEEVLQNDKYIGIVLEYASGGELFDYILEHRYLKESMACRLFAQLVSGVDYMHSKGIVHRDLKLENLLLDKHKNIIITDFGFVNTFQGSDFMKTSCGSPCYAAPELVVSSDSYEGKKVDVWSCGIILYAMLAGYLPFDDDPQNPDGDNIARLYHYITHTPLTFPEYIQPTPRDLLRKVIVSNPKKRIDLKQIRSHQWLSPHAPFLSVTPIEWDKNHQSAAQNTRQQQQDKANRRLSLMENPTSASLMMNRPNMKSYSTHNVSAMLYSSPVAPQTSRTVAIPSSSSSTSINNMVPQPIAIKTPSSGYSGPEIYRGGHQRTGSSASIVLQAVVEADNFEVSRRNSVSNDALPKANIPRSTTHTGIISDTASFVTHRSRSGSVSSSTNLGLNFETIAESPDNVRTVGEPDDASLLHMLPPTSRPNGSGTSQSSTTSTVTKLPTRANRPRPTSYHPASSSSGYQFPSPDLSFLLSSGTFDYNQSRPQFESRTSSKKSVVDSVSSSPVKEQRNSWCQPKITEPIVDMTIANGVLTSLNAAAIETEENENTMPKSEKRKSAALDSLSNAIDLFSISSTTTPSSPAALVSELPQLEEITAMKKPLSSATEDVNNDKLEKQNVDFKFEAGAELPSSGQDIKVHQDTIEKPNPSTLADPIEDNELVTPLVELNSATNNNKLKEDTKGSSSSVQKLHEQEGQHQSHTANHQSSSQHQPIAKTRTRTSEKENRVNVTSAPNSTKFKRFSFGFYAHNNSSDSTNIPASATTNAARRVLESSNSTVQLGPAINQSSIATKRMTMGPGSIPPNSKSSKEKEGSTAKRVMDFFKRRSIRI
ncbi:hypothetical protein CANARDRAFT_27149 [[Candida] arabinofermentans NRRL YB-2248]|uniref:non-specific serine/threonine protein kinase n=1 Tax=[Candida] arabinofermentans NRRL YB-2248 TaxID=983967 RepID=A0A1E4T4Q2_9ASCO|nr:hypothetical protein CANARDRAFT_27149 [[Candida] arabinofermentans NRRL YB-2248]